MDEVTKYYFKQAVNIFLGWGKKEVELAVKNCFNVKNLKYTYLHRQCVKHLADEYGVMNESIANHDVDKLVLYLFFDKEMVHRIHVNMNKHHNRSLVDRDVIIESMLDWESAHYTKPDKPLSAYETYMREKERFPECYEGVLKDLGLWEKGNYELPTLCEFEKMYLEVNLDDVVDDIYNSRDHLEQMLHGLD